MVRGLLMEPKALMFLILEKLKTRNFNLQYHQAFSTNSCYIKLDYGMSGSIRISDHHDKGKYQYKFNLITSLDRSFQHNNRNFYCLDDLTKMLNDILWMRKLRVSLYGKSYYEQMFQYKYQKAKKGFDTYAKVYTKEDEVQEEINPPKTNMLYCKYTGEYLKIKKNKRKKQKKRSFKNGKRKI